MFLKSKLLHNQSVKLFGIICLLTGLISLPTGCMKKGGPPNFGPIMVDVSPVDVRDIAQYFETVGSFTNDDNVSLKAETEGRVEKIFVQEGDKVQPGQVLLVVDNTKLISEVKEAEAAITSVKNDLLSLAEQNNQAKTSIKIEEANLKKAQSDYKRYQELFKKEFISKMELDQMEANYTVAAAKVESAKYNELGTANKIKSAQGQLDQLKQQLKFKQINLNNADINAPKEGFINEKFVAEGDYVSPGTKLLSLVSLSRLKMKFSVPENYFKNIHLGQPVDVRLNSSDNKLRTATVSFISPQIDEETRQFTVKADIKSQDQAYYRSGMFANIKIPVSSYKKTVIIPEEAIIHIGNLAYVYVYKDGKALLTNIKSGLREQGKVQVTEGLDTTAIVIKTGQQKLRDGMPVKPREKN